MVEISMTAGKEKSYTVWRKIGQKSYKKRVQYLRKMSKFL